MKHPIRGTPLALITVTLGILCLVAVPSASAASSDPDGIIRIASGQVQAGQQIQVELQSPSDTPFIQQLRIFKNPTPEAISSNQWPLVNMLGSVPITAEQDAVRVGQPFTVNVDTLYYGPGTYYFVTFAPGRTSIHAHVDILTAGEAPLNSAASGLYTLDGQLVVGFGTNDPAATLSRQTGYLLVIDLNQLKGFTNSIYADFYDPTGQVLEKATLLEIKIARNRSFAQALTFSNDCPGLLIDRAEFPQGIARIAFRTPDHLKYYENDGQLRLRFSGVAVDSTNCGSKEFSLTASLNDPPAHPAIPSFAAFNEREYPGQDWRNNYPFAARHARLVRFGNLSLTNELELQDLAAELTQRFASAAKGYFTLTVDAIHQFPLVGTNNQPKVMAWYDALPKTPNKRVLDLNNPDELYLATLLYYNEHPEAEFEADLKRVYPLQSNGEDLTLYLYDGPGELGIAMGAVGTRIKATRLYPIWIFYQGSGAAKTYHFDLETCQFCGSGTPEFLAFLARDGTTTQIINTTIHELGHVYWMKPVGVSSGDLSTRAIPFNSDTVLRDDAVGYFTRFEYMSYGRNRETLDGLSYGDAFLERILAAYPLPLDSDADGLPDEWEMEHFGSPTVATPEQDPDQDGFSNLQEFLAGTRPSDNTSFFSISGVSHQDATTTVSFAARAGRRYTLEYRDDLMAAQPWSNVPSQVDVPGSDGLMSLSDTSLASRRYYRVRVSAP